MTSSLPGDGPAEGQRLPRAARIRRGVEIRALLRTGTRVRGPLLDVFTSAAPGPAPRFGTIVPKHRHSVVERNLVRRRLREIGRTEVLPRLRTRGRKLDLLVRARPDAYRASFDDLRAELVRITERLCSDVSPSA